ncbi:MAG: T9SS type A sorting domain-containing protein [Bacteroidales bacterium]|nr:T9SS type A sorting domain-containing protein [Bacteroidales bacterium]
MKKILLSLFCLTIFSAVFSQSFSLQDTNGVAINAGATIQVLGEPTDDVITAKIHVKNNAGDAKDVKVKKVINEGNVLPNTMNYFCWGVCYGPDTYESPFAQNIAAGAVNDQFYGDYNPQAVPGKSTISYVFFDANNRNDSVAVTVEFYASPAFIADDLAKLVKFSDAYPNPAISKVNVDYAIPEYVRTATITITNMLGAEVRKVNLDEHNGTARIQVSELLNGIYFYSLVADDKIVLTRKFVVKH